MTRKIALIPLILLIGLSVGACDTAEERAEKHFQNATALIQEGDHIRARIELLNVFKLDPTHREARRAYAKGLDDDGKLNEALQHYLFLVENYPNDFEGVLRLAEISVRLGAWVEADRYGRRAAELDPEPIRVQAIVAALDYRQSIIENDGARRTQVADRVQKLTEVLPQDIALRQILIDWFVFQGREREALAQVDQALEMASGDIRLYRMRLSLLNTLGEFPELEEQLLDMVTRFPDNTDFQLQVIQWYISRGDAESAENFVRDLADGSDDAKRVGLQFELVQLVRATKGSDEALAEIEKILLDTSNPDIFRSIRAGLIFDGGDRETAMAELEQLVANGEPSDQTRTFKIILARMQRSIGNQVGARALVEEVLAEDPTQVEALKMKADFLIDGDKADEAVALLRRALDQKPTNASILTITARAHERNGDRELMGEALALAAEVSGAAPLESLRLAGFLASRGQLAPAEQALIESLRRNPNHAQLLSQLGAIYMQMEKLEDAIIIEDRLRSLDTDETTSQADGLKLAVLRAQNRNEDVVSLIQELAGADLDRARGMIALIRTYLASGDFDKASDVLAKAVLEEPENLQLRFAEGVVSGIGGDSESAQAIFREILESEPLSTSTWLALARNIQSEGDEATGEAVIDEAIAAVPQSGGLKLVKAGYLERRSDIAGAIEIYEGLYDESSSSLITANNLASLLSSYSDDPDTVERAYTIARRLRGLPQAAFKDTYGWIAFQRGQHEDALEHLQPAADGLPDDPLVQYHLARTYQVLDQHQNAVEQYQKVLTLTGGEPRSPMTDTAARLDAANKAAEGQ